MLLSFAYFAVGAVLRLLVGGRRGELDKDIEVIVLRHQLMVLRRRGKRPKFKPADRAFIAALARRLPYQRRHGLAVTPQTLLHPRVKRRDAHWVCQTLSRHRRRVAKMALDADPVTNNIQNKTTAPPAVPCKGRCGRRGFTSRSDNNVAVTIAPTQDRNERRAGSRASAPP